MGGTVSIQWHGDVRDGHIAESASLKFEVL